MFGDSGDMNYYRIDWHKFGSYMNDKNVNYVCTSKIPLNVCADRWD